MTANGLSGNRERRRRVFNRIMNVLIYAALVAAIVPLVAIVGEVVIQGLPQISLGFLTGLPRPPTLPGGGIFNAIEGSAVMVGLAALIAVPLGVGAGIYFSEWPESRLSFISSFTNDVLAEFPTITLGIFVYLLVVLTTHTFSAIAGAIASTGATSMKQMGGVVKAAKEALTGKSVDGKALSDRVRERLSKM